MLDSYLPAAQVYNVTQSSGERAIVTYAGFEKQAYIDGAVMLGRSLARLRLRAQLVCLVQRTMADASKLRLEAAGWTLQEVQPWLPEGWNKRNCGYWHDAYNKVDIFRLPFSQVLYLDADTYVFGKRSDLRPLVDQELRPEEIKMVGDVNGVSYNSGVMVFRPSLEAFRSVHSAMATGLLDQPAINKAFDGRIIELPFRYNVHGYGEHNCSDVVVAHFTGLHKPAEARSANMQLVADGTAAQGKFALSCANLFTDYFRDLHREAEFLSPELRGLLGRTEFGLPSAGSLRK
uniref:Hexosyltransferase n=1 Tax=Alexandrium catenella TaxID=2925 RepID=A0A7S1RAD8_ALECA